MACGSCSLSTPLASSVALPVLATRAVSLYNERWVSVRFSGSDVLAELFYSLGQLTATRGVRRPALRLRFILVCTVIGPQFTW